MTQGGIRGEFGGAQKRMTSRIFPILVSLLVAALLLGAADIIVAPNAAVAAPADVCKGKKADRPAECDGDSGGGDGGTTGLLDLEALLVGEFPGEPGGMLQACATSGVGVGPFDDPDKDKLMNDKFFALVDGFGAVLPAPGLEDQLFGFGHSVFDAVSDNVIQIQFLNTSTGSGAVNRVLLEGPPNRKVGNPCFDGNETETIHGAIYLMLGHGDSASELGGDCPEGVDLCIMSFMVGARLGNNKFVYGIDTVDSNETYLDPPLELDTTPCLSTVVPIFDRFRMEQQGRKFVVHGTLSYGELHFWVLPEDGTCPLPS